MSLLAGCLQNTLIGNTDSCSTNACICKVGFATPDCCECDLTGVNGQPHYLDPDTNQCTRESMHAWTKWSSFINPTKLCYIAG